MKLQDSRPTIVATLLIVSIILAWLFRYDLNTGGTESTAATHMLDRWTGKVWYIKGAVIYPTEYDTPEVEYIGPIKK